MYRYIVVLITLLTTLVTPQAASVAAEVSRPRLVVNIVVGSLKSTDLDRYSQNFSSLGFNRMGYEGSRFTAANYSFQVGATSASLATIATGATPSIHGVVGDAWYDLTSAQRVELTADEKCKNVEFDISEGGDSPLNLIAPTLTETLRDQIAGSQSATIALNATSAIALGGRGGVALWFDPYSTTWTTSTAYAPKIQEWVKEFNQIPIAIEGWKALLDRSKYLNRRNFGLLPKKNASLEITAPSKEEIKRWRNIETFNHIAYTPAGNKLTLDMAYHTIEKMGLGADEVPDIINIMLDTSGNIVGRFGSESVEAEDMFYRLDRDLADFIEKVRTRVADRDVVFVLTSDHGTSPAYDATTSGEKRLFNTQQFEVVLNTFLGSKYGAEQWVVGYENSSIYLNHALIYNQKLNLESIQNEVASFALQFRGVSHAITASAMRNSYFGAGYGERMQRGFFPRRSGDIVINLMPEWIEAREGVRSSSGSIYRYDTHVPLLIFGAGVPHKRVTRPINICSIAPTIAAIMGITEPAATEGDIIEEVINR